MTRAQLLARSPLRRALDVVLGGVVLLLGAVLVVTPGPGSLVIPVGLGLLGREFRWARRGSVVLKRRVRGWLACARGAA